MDIKKIEAYANMLGPNTPISVRWEGSGDSVHAYNLLKELQKITYSNSNGKMKYIAVVNIFEPFENQNAQKAWKYMALIHQELDLLPNPNTGEVFCDKFYNKSADQVCFLYYNMNVVRASAAVKQPKAHVMFVRNIMLTDPDDYSKSRIEDAGPLLDLHTQAIRERANSLTKGGEFRLGMSGAPGLNKPKGEKRTGEGPMQLSDAYHGFPELLKTGVQAGLKLTTNKNFGQEFDTGPVMLNKGEQTQQKKTYYLTFQNPT